MIRQTHFWFKSQKMTAKSTFCTARDIEKYIESISFIHIILFMITQIIH
jgi:hypothetical protein